MTLSSLKSPAVAVIDEQACIGCKLCIQACPVDAIVGAARLMHTVIAAECIGCKLCLPPCPVDCIVMAVTGSPLTREERKLRAAQARLRYTRRLAREQAKGATPPGNVSGRRKRATIERVMQRARERLRSR